MQHLWAWCSSCRGSRGATERAGSLRGTISGTGVGGRPPAHVHSKVLTVIFASLLSATVTFAAVTFDAATVLLILLVAFSVICHEVAHGLVALLLGDPTAARAGRLTLNPIPHIDPFGTVILPLILKLSGSPVVFAWAKPVPINPTYFKRPRRDLMFVAAAGPLTNALLACLFAALFHLLRAVAPPAVLEALVWGSVVNVILMAFNLIPLPPLDGSRIVAAFLPRELVRAYRSLEPYGLFIVALLLLTGTLNALLRPVLKTAFRLFGFL